MTAPQVTVRFGDDALRALVAHAARRVPGVVRLQRRPAARTMSRVGAVVRARESTRESTATSIEVAADASAIELGRTSTGTLEVSVRLVSALQPRPLQVVAAVGDAVRQRLAEAGEHDVRVEVTVTDVLGVGAATGR